MVANFINEIFIYPTDSVWGIGADAKSAEKNNWIRLFKRRAEGTPFSVLFHHFDQLESYLDLTDFNDKKLFKKVLTMQSTFLLPLKWLKNSDLGPWIYAESEFIGVRVLDLPWIKKMTNNGPITTTSCNFTGSPAIADLAEAEKFYKEHCPDCSFIYPDNQSYEYGKPSTIIKYDQSCFEIIREGSNVDSIRELLEI